MDWSKILIILEVFVMIMFMIITLIGMVIVSDSLVALMGISGWMSWFASLAVAFTWMYGMMSLPVFEKAHDEVLR